jgi:hypothetical protein
MVASFRFESVYHLIKRFLSHFLILKGSSFRLALGTGLIFGSVTVISGGRRNPTDRPPDCRRGS